MIRSGTCDPSRLPSFDSKQQRCILAICKVVYPCSFVYKGAPENFHSYRSRGGGGFRRKKMQVFSQNKKECLESSET